MKTRKDKNGIEWMAKVKDMEFERMVKEKDETIKLLTSLLKQYAPKVFGKKPTNNK